MDSSPRNTVALLKLFTNSLLAATNQLHALFASPATKVNWNFGSYMDLKQDNIRSKPGSIKVGATGKVSTLVTRELDDLEHSPSNHLSRKRNTQSFPVTVCSEESRKQTSYKPANTTRSTDQRIETKIQQKMHNMRHMGFDIPKPASENVCIHRKSVKDEKRRTQFVEVVNLKCGTSLKKAWSSRTSNNAKVKFSRLSASI